MSLPLSRGGSLSLLAPTFFHSNRVMRIMILCLFNSMLDRADGEDWLITQRLDGPVLSRPSLPYSVRKVNSLSVYGSAGGHEAFR